MKKEEGFTLVELLVYTLAGYFLVTVLITALWVVYGRLAQVRAYNAAYATAVVAIDMITRDCATLSSQPSSYYKVADTGIIWSLPDGNSRGYELAGTTLKRMDGHYDKNQQRWHEGTTSVVLQQVKKLHVALQSSAGAVRSLTLSFVVEGGGKDIPVGTFYSIRNRYIG